MAQESYLGSIWPNTHMFYTTPLLIWKGLEGRWDLVGKDSLTLVPEELVLMAPGEMTVH